MRKITCTALLVVATILGTAPMVDAQVAGPSSGPSVRITNVDLVEGDDGITKAVFVVTASGSGRGSVEFSTADGTALAGLDYTAASGTLNFSAHKPTRRIAVEVVGDLINEPDERFLIKLSSTGPTAIADSKGRATIADDDEGGPSISVADGTAREGQSAGFTVALSAPLTETVTVNFATANGSAVSPADYQAVSGSLTFSPGQTVHQLVVPLSGDTIPELSETFAVNLSNATGVAIADGVGLGTITDDDVPTISLGNATVTEGHVGSVNAVFTATLSAATSEAVTADFTTANGSAVAPTDYQSSTGTIAFDPGETVQQVVVTVVGDSTSETTETFGVNLTNLTGATMLDGVGLGTITDDDTPTIAVANAAVTEGNFGTSGALFTVTLSAMSSQPVTMSFATANGSATAPADYLSTSGALTFDPGETVQQIVVPVVGDTVIETTESFSLNLSAPVNATFSDATAQGTITDNDTVTISIGAATVTEVNAPATRDAVFTVTLSAVSGSTITVDFATANGSAVAPGDYLATSGTLTFAPGEVSKQIAVVTIGDALIEANETFSVNLSNSANASIAGSGFGLGTITNND